MYCTYCTFLYCKVLCIWFDSLTWYWLYSTYLYCTILYYTVIYCTVLYCIVLCTWFDCLTWYWFAVRTVSLTTTWSVVLWMWTSHCRLKPKTFLIKIKIKYKWIFVSQPKWPKSLAFRMISTLYVSSVIVADMSVTFWPPRPYGF